MAVKSLCGRTVYMYIDTLKTQLSMYIYMLAATLYFAPPC